MKTRYLFLWLMAAAVYALCLVPTTDPDMGWHLKTGEWVLRHGVPTTDPFSFSVTGRFWTAHEWLSEVIMRSFYGLGEYSALMISFALIGVLTFLVVYRTCPRRPYLSAIAAFVAVLASRFLWGARPQIFNILMMSVVLWVIQSVRLRRISPKGLFVLPLLTCLWVNLHSGYLLGIVVMLAFLVGDLFQIYVIRSDEGTLGEKGLGLFSVILLLCVAAVGLNPSGYKILLYPFMTLSSKLMQAHIQEWKTPVFQHYNYWPFLGMMSVGASALLLFPPKRNVANFLIYVGAMAMGLFARRHIPFFAIFAMPVIAGAVSDGLSTPGWIVRWSDASLSGSLRIFRYFLNVLLALGIMVALFGWTGYFVKRNPFIMKKAFPVQAAQFLKEKGPHPPKRILNAYSWGGYLIWEDIPVYVDGRADLYGDLFLREYLDVDDMRMPPRDILNFLMRNDIDGMLLNVWSPLAAAFATNPEWKRVYWDSTAVLFRRATSFSGAVPDPRSPRLYRPLKFGRNRQARVP